MKIKVAVIGSGVGGLASAIRLAKLGVDVTVFEKNSFVGGKVHSRTFSGYRFDMGPSVFTEPHLIQELVRLATNVKAFEYKSLDESGRYFYPDGTQLEMKSGTNGTIKVLTKDLHEDKRKVIQYLERIKKNYKSLHPVFIETSLHRLSHWLNLSLIPAILNIPKYGLFTTMNGFSKRYFKNPKTIQLLNRYATYNGSDPFQTPGLLSIIGHLELNIGSYFPNGGMVSISRKLEDTARSLGVKFELDAPVQSIRISDGKVLGVIVKEEFFQASIVVSNVDVHYTYETLMPSVKRPIKILAQEMSSSAVVFYWGINRSFKELGVHNVFFSSDYQAEFNAIFKQKVLFSDPTVYIHISAKVEPGDAPLGCENWFVMVNAPINQGQDWGVMVKELKENVLMKLSKQLKTDVSSYIQTEYINDPIKLQQTYNGKAGSIYGNSSNSSMAAFYRHPNHAPSVKGMYFAGVTVHPGGGIPLALNGAKIVERMARETFNL